MDQGEVLTNLEFDYPFAGKIYKLKRASLKNVMDLQRKIAEIKKEEDPAGDLRAISHALYLSLHAADSTITEQYVEENASGDIDPIDTLITLGFTGRQQLASLMKIKNESVNQSSGTKSLV